MAITSVKLRNSFQTCYVDTGEIPIEMCCLYIVETEHGVDIGRVLKCGKNNLNDKNIEKLGKLLRATNPEDLKLLPEIENLEKRAFDVCTEKVTKRNLDMKLVTVKCLFDKTKIIFYFIAENRVDFRELVKDLASVFRTRIEMRQIGVRDEAKLIGGFGLCGRELCCGHLKEVFDPVSIKMAKEQNLNLNTLKISGMCGRLLCCLSYEYDVYKELNKNLPASGSNIQAGERIYTVEMVDTLKNVVVLKDGNSYINVNGKVLERRGDKYYIRPDEIQNIFNIYNEEPAEKKNH